MARTIHLSLFQKGLIVAAVPLAFELLFIALLTWNLYQTEQAARKEEHAKLILADSNMVSACMYDAASTLVLYGLTKKPAAGEKFDRLMEEIRRRKKNLRDEVQENETERRLFVPVDRTSDELLTMLVSTKQSVDEGGRDLAVLSNLETRLGAQRSLHKLMTEMNSFVEHARAVEKSAPGYRKTSKVLLWALLIGGALVSVLTALAVVVVISRGFTDRLGVMAQNAVRLAKGEPLMDKLGGGDEITSLDHTFHEMAGQLIAAKVTLQAAEARVRTVIETVPVALIIVSEDGVIESVNQCACSVFGYSEEELTGKPLTFLFTARKGSDGPIDEKAVLDELTAKNSTETTVACKSGLRCPVEVSVRELRLDNLPKVLVTAMDISEREEMAQLKREFAAMLTHDLRAPLTSIQLFLGIIPRHLYGPVPKQIDDGAQTAHRSAARLIRLVDDIMDVEKLESGRLQLECEPIMVETLLTRALEAVRWSLEKREISFQTEGDTKVEVLVDADRMVRVLINLFSNAIKFSPDCGKILFKCDCDGSSVVLHVIDHGPGIAAEFRDVIFEKYTQLRSPGTAGRGGSGLGLATCKLIAEAHGGGIAVDAAPGGGSDFWLTIPKNRSV